MAKLTAEQVSDLAHALLGTADSIETHLELTLGVESADYDIDEIESQLTERVERCMVCDWWHEPGELIAVDDDDAEPGVCDQCREELD